MIGQIPLAWPEILDHSVAVGVVLFFGIGLTWTAKRLFGAEGIVTRSAEIASECTQENVKILQAMKDSHAAQLSQCGVHAAAMVSLDEASVELVHLHKDPNSVFATVHLTDGALAACDVLEAAHPEGKAAIARIRRKLKGETT